jgi:mono/diheme cytochrome c family protein
MNLPKFSARLLFGVAITLTAGASSTQSTWQVQHPRDAYEYFHYGSIGADIVPLPVFQVLPEMYPDNFHPGDKEAGDWIDQFGFVRRPDSKPGDLPVGFTVTHHLPGSGKHSLTPYVGLTCAVCHEGQIRFPDSSRNVLVPGMGNSSLDLVAFGDAVKAAIRDEKGLTVRTINAAYKKHFQRSLTRVERLSITLWLSAVRKQIERDLPITGEPVEWRHLRDSQFIPSGPGRIMAARDAIRRLQLVSPEPNGGPSKLPALYHQRRREWAQFDGSVRNPLTRNAIAALGVGATPKNLQVPDILASIVQSFGYVLALDGPPNGKVFPTIDTASASRGREIYEDYCSSCHGSPGRSSGEWTHGTRLGKVIPVAEIGTDPERVTPQYYDQLPELFLKEYPAGHPLKPQPSDVRTTHGYITTPLESVFSRAPFLHNGSVPTLAELINLKPRRNLFFRGTEYFDVPDVGLLVADTADSRRYYRFDASARGNSNKGHDYPWPYRGGGWDEGKLKDLLEYLKTL